MKRRNVEVISWGKKVQKKYRKKYMEDLVSGKVKYRRKRRTRRQAGLEKIECFIEGVVSSR